MKIAVGGVAHETNTFSTVPTEMEDFTVQRGQECLRDGFWRERSFDGHSIAPLLQAHATPSGKVTRRCFGALLGELIERLKAAGTVDGVLLNLHGAMEVEEIGDGETAILSAVREVVGREPLVAVTLDLHANLAPAVAEMADIVTAYRTAPHRDAVRTRERGATLLLECLRKTRDGAPRPTTALVKLPLLVGGEAAVTEAAPASELYARIQPAIDRHAVLDASILIGCAWTDSPFTSVSTLACGYDPAAARAAAGELAGAVWERRAEFSIDSPTADVDNAIRMVGRSAAHPVFISDSGDNPTAGAAGDMPLFLDHLLRSGAEGFLVAGVADAEAVRACFAAGRGGDARINLGGKLDAVNAAPLPLRVMVKGLFQSDPKFADAAFVSAGPVDIVIQSLRRPFTELDDFRRLGLDPDAYRAVVVKLGYLFPELRDYAPAHIMALSPGFGDQRIERLPFRRLPRPMYPLDRDATPTA